MYTAIFTIVKSSCAVPVTDRQIQKAIREGLNTIRLHDRGRKIKKARIQGQQNDDSDSSNPAEFIEQSEDSEVKSQMTYELSAFYLRSQMPS